MLSASFRLRNKLNLIAMMNNKKYLSMMNSYNKITQIVRISSNNKKNQQNVKDFWNLLEIH